MYLKDGGLLVSLDTVYQLTAGVLQRQRVALLLVETLIIFRYDMIMI